LVKEGYLEVGAGGGGEEDVARVDVDNVGEAGEGEGDGPNAAVVNVKTDL